MLILIPLLTLSALSLISTQTLSSLSLAYLKPSTLLKNKSTIPTNSTSITELKRKAHLALSRSTIFSVINKKQLPPSNDIHDYYSLARYWWPNPDSPDSLPYVRRDGQVNPEIWQVTDYDQFAMFEKDVVYLTFAYYFLDDDRFGGKAIELIKTWFIDENTRMNPHLMYGSYIKGQPQGRAYGIIDLHDNYILVDCLTLLSASSQWTPDLTEKLHSWYSRYFDFLINSDIGREEYENRNNHGTYFDVQAISIAAYLGKVEEAKKMCAVAASFRIDDQIAEDGSQPHETARANSWFYSKFNMEGLSVLANLCGNVGVDLWRYKNVNGGMQAAMDYLLPFASGQQWPYRNVPADLDETYLLGSSLFEMANELQSKEYWDKLLTLTMGNVFYRPDGWVKDLVGNHVLSKAGGLYVPFGFRTLSLFDVNVKTKIVEEEENTDE